MLKPSSSNTCVNFIKAKDIMIKQATVIILETIPSLTLNFVISKKVCHSALLGVAHRACLADNGDFHLSRIGHRILYLLCNIVREFFDSRIVYLAAEPLFSPHSSLPSPPWSSPMRPWAKGGRRQSSSAII